MRWTEFFVAIRDVIWFKVFPFITQYWNIFPCACLCAEVCGEMWLFWKVSTVLERRGTGTGARDVMSSFLHATCSPMDGQTLCYCWRDVPCNWLAVFREPAVFVHSPARTIICRPVTLDTHVRSLLYIAAIVSVLRARCLAISNVWFLYGLPLYFLRW